jgi:hypothetical protein
VNHPLLSVALKSVRPTQISVGMAEVTAKRESWRNMRKKDQKELLATHWFPAILGPKGEAYIIDHHHLGLALLQEGVSHVWVLVQRNFSWLDIDVFWHAMEFYHWAYPYNEQGRRTDYSMIPAKLAGLRDDPYRSLAARVRLAGGYAKDAAPYAEFLWADFYRPRIKLKGDEPFGGKVIRKALLLAHEHEAAYLPGWSGNIE